MIKIKKGFKSKIVLLILSILFLFQNLLYASPCHTAKGALRVPVGGYERLRKVLGSNHAMWTKKGLHRRNEDAVKAKWPVFSLGDGLGGHRTGYIARVV